MRTVFCRNKTNTILGFIRSCAFGFSGEGFFAGDAENMFCSRQFCRNQVGLVLEGGGMRGGFVAGAIMALMDKGLNSFKSALAVSASVPTLAYFAAGQRAEMERVWREELNTSNFVCYRHIPAASLTLSAKKPVLDIDYLIDDVFIKKYPLDIQRLTQSKIACYFAVTMAPEGSLAFLRPGDADIYKIFKAALAVPGCYPSTVRVGGSEYIDGGTSNALPADYLLNGKVRRILAILSTPLDCGREAPNLFARILFWRYFQKYEWMTEKLRESARAYEKQVGLLGQLARLSPARAFIIAPDKMPAARFITRDRQKINQTIDSGYEKVERLENQIRQFLIGDRQKISLYRILNFFRRRPLRC